MATRSGISESVMREDVMNLTVGCDGRARRSLALARLWVHSGRSAVRRFSDRVSAYCRAQLEEVGAGELEASESPAFPHVSRFVGSGRNRRCAAPVLPVSRIIPAARPDTRVVSVRDREGDLRDLLSGADLHGDALSVRAGRPAKRRSACGTMSPRRTGSS